MNTNLHPFSPPSLLTKRLVFLADKPAEDTLATESGLENPEQVITQDDNQNLMEKVGKVYVIDDPKEFYETFSFLKEENDLLPIDSVIETGEINTHLRAGVMNLLVKRMNKIVPKDTMTNINKLQGATLDANTDVTDTAKATLDAITSSDPSEQDFYKHLADVVGSMGLKKDQLMRTNELNGKLKNVEKERNLAQDRLDLMKAQIKHVEDLEEKAKKDYEKTKKWTKRRVSVLMGIAGVAASPALLGVVGSVSVAALIGAVGGYGLRKLGQLGASKSGQLESWIGKTSFGEKYERHMSLSSNDKSSLDMQRALLDDGYIKLKKGTHIHEFRLPQPVLIGKDGIIDGRKVTNPNGEKAHRGAIVTTDVLEDITLELPKIRIDGKEEAGSQKNIEKHRASKQDQLDQVTSTLANHDAELAVMKRSFEKNYIELESKVEDAKRIMGTMSQQLAIAKMREGEEGADTEYIQAKKAFDAAKEVMNNAKEALKAFDQVKRVYGLNDRFAKQPVSKESLEGIYQQTVIPKALKIMIDHSTLQTERTKKAQEDLGKMSGKKLNELCGKLDKADVKAGKDFLSKIDDLRGSSDEIALALSPFLKRIQKKNKALFAFCMAMVQVPPGTRYAMKPEQLKSPQKLLEDAISGRGAEVGGEEKAAEEAEKKAEETEKKKESNEGETGEGKGKSGQAKTTESKKSWVEEHFNSLENGEGTDEGEEGGFKEDDEGKTVPGMAVVNIEKLGEMIKSSLDEAFANIGKEQELDGDLNTLATSLILDDTGVDSENPKSDPEEGDNTAPESTDSSG